MSLLERIKKLEQIVKPKMKVKMVKAKSEITDEPNVIWVLINL